jgi:hypothetical protein
MPNLCEFQWPNFLGFWSYVFYAGDTAGATLLPSSERTVA